MNLKDEVIVQLTPEGEKVFTENCIFRALENKNHVYTFEIWELMRIFGGRVRNDDIFVNNKLTLEKSNAR